MTLQPNIFADIEVDKLLLEHNNQPMKALYQALEDTANQGIELPMAIIMDRRCGIERKAEEADVLRYLVGATPLLLAIYAQRVDVARALLAAGADPNAKASDGNNSLKEAAREGYLEAVESLISYGADINAVDRNVWSPLHNAAILGHTSAVEILERAGANLEAVDNEGQTPLHIAASYCRAGTIESLLKMGANQAAVNNEGRTPLHCAAANLFVSVVVIGAFRCNAFEAHLTAVDKNGLTPLQVCESRSYGNFYGSNICALLTPK